MYFITRRLAFGTLVLLAAAGFSTRALAQAPVNLVTNPGFETGDLTGYTVTPAADGSFYDVSAGDPHSGTYALNFGAGDSAYFDMISQALNTAGATTFDVSFYLKDTDTANTSAFIVTFGNDTLLSLTNPDAFGYTQYTFTGVAGTGDTTTITFAGNNPPALYELDDISVTASVPEPATGAVFLVGAGVLGWLARRRATTRAV